MKKETLKQLMKEYGDATITYRSANSNKVKYNVCTTDFSTTYIKSKGVKAQETEDTVLMWCWDCDAFRLIKVDSIKSVIPLSSTLKNER
jgi:hypothetical protein